MNTRGNIDRFVAIVLVQQEIKGVRHDKQGEIWMSLITRGRIHQGDEWFRDDSRGKRDLHVFACCSTM